MSDPDESGFRSLSEAELYESLIQAARDGDRDHAVGLLEDFIAAGTSDELGPVPTYLIRYIAECLQFWQSDDFQGKKARSAFNVTQSKHRPHDPASRQKHIAAIRVFYRSRLDGVTYEEAMHAAAESVHISASMMKQILFPKTDEAELRVFAAVLGLSKEEREKIARLGRRKDS